MQRGCVEEVKVEVVVVAVRVLVLVVVHRHCHQFCQRLVWWCGGWALVEVQLT